MPEGVSRLVREPDILSAQTVSDTRSQEDLSVRNQLSEVLFSIRCARFVRYCLLEESLTGKSDAIVCQFFHNYLCLKGEMPTKSGCLALFFVEKGQVKLT